MNRKSSQRHCSLVDPGIKRIYLAKTLELLPLFSKNEGNSFRVIERKCEHADHADVHDDENDEAEADNTHHFNMSAPKAKLLSTPMVCNT